MKTYDVTIQATITKTHRVEAETKGKAVEQAHERFSVFNDDTPEKYNEEILDIVEVTP
jgi:hypothetical protein